MGADQMTIDQLENTIREAGGPVAQHVVKVGSNYYCHLTGTTISSAEYKTLVSRLGSSATDGLTPEERRLRNRVHAAVERTEARAERTRNRGRGR